MASVFDILGITHIAVSSIVQLIGVLKLQLNAYRSLPSLLDSAGEKASRIDQSITSLRNLAEVSTLDSEFFARISSYVQDVQHELISIQAEIANNSSAARFVFASRLQRRLINVNGELHEIDRSLSAVGMIGEIVSNLGQGIDTRFDQLGALINRALKSSNPSIAAESLLDSIRTNQLDPADGSVRHRDVFHMLSSEKDGHLFFVLGRSRYLGDVDGVKDFPRAARYLHAAFAEGYNMAAFYLGNLCYYGNGVKLNYRSAFEYYSVGAQSGNTAAMACLGWMFAFGCGVEVNSRLGVKWFNEAAERGNGLGLLQSGQYSLHGNATRQNIPKAVRYFRAALKAGESKAGAQLGLCYLYGIGVDRNLRKAVKHFREAYESTGSETATFWLASYYEGIEQNYVEAAMLYKELAECRTPLARNYGCYYGRFLVRGLGVTQDINEGIKIVRRSLKRDVGGGWFVLGDMYRHGYGVRLDISVAVRYFSKAILCSGGAYGVVNSDKALAELYETSDGVVLNLTKAAHHYVRAANRLDPFAQWKAGSFFETGTGVDENIQRAFVFFDMSARGGLVQAQRKAGELYLRGKGVERDRSKAIRLLQEAADRGDTRASTVLRRTRRPKLLCWRRVNTD